MISAADSSLLPRAAISPSIIIVLLLKIDNIHKAHRFCAGDAVKAHGVTFIQDVGLVGNAAFQCALLDKYIFLCDGRMAFGQVFFAGQNGHGEYVKASLGCGREAAILGCIDPLVAVIISYFCLQEPMTISQAAGGAMILGFTLLTQTSK